MKKLHIGTSGWMYDHWEGRFYPRGLKKEEWLRHYCRYFGTVEINNTFYHLPKEAVFKGWRKKARKGFLYAVKGNRFITHIKRLRDCREPLQLFFSRVKYLGPALGPVLFQLPPKMKKDLMKLESFLKLLPKRKRFVFEFRNPEWFDEEVYALLRKYKASFCVYSMPGHECPKVITSSLVYIRMHGGSIIYGSNYSDKELKKLAQQIRGYLKKKLEVYVYFNNDASGYAVKNALRLKELLS